MWVKQDEDLKMPEWLSSNISPKCKYCGSDMMNYYNSDGRCTNRRCSNDNCPAMIAARADFMRNLLGIKNVGFATCLSTIKARGITNPVELLGVWGLKVKMPLGVYLRIHCFEGVDSEWENITQSLNVFTLDDLYEKYDGKWKSLLDANKELLYSDLKYVELDAPTNDFKGEAVILRVMITGTPNGFATKDEFIAACNYVLAGRIIVIHQRTKKQSGVDYLIREPGSTTRGKVEAAKKGGIPIVTSQEFFYILSEKLQTLGYV